MGFPRNFIWGAASAAAQIEGGWDEDGRTPSIWDLMPEGRIAKNENCHVACDHYHRWREDVALMKGIGLKAYRFSVSWSRVIPAPGRVNEVGLRFYSDLVDALVEAGITPMITLFHSDLPQWAFEKGGWNEVLNRMLPGMAHRLSANPAVAGLSLRRVAGFAKGAISDDVLEELDLALRRLTEENQ